MTADLPRGGLADRAELIEMLHEQRALGICPMMPADESVDAPTNGR